MFEISGNSIFLLKKLEKSVLEIGWSAEGTAVMVQVFLTIASPETEFHGHL